MVSGSFGAGPGWKRALAASQVDQYQRATKREKGVILDAICARTGWHRTHARRVLHEIAYGEELMPGRWSCQRDSQVIEALRECWLIAGRPTGKRLAPILPALVERLRAFGELDLDDDAARRLARISPATIDRALAPSRASSVGRGGRAVGRLTPPHVRIAPDTELGRCDVRLWRGAIGPGWAYLVTVTELATGWQETRAVRARPDDLGLFEALDELTSASPIPVVAVETEPITQMIRRYWQPYCRQQHIALHRRVGNPSPRSERTAQAFLARFETVGPRPSHDPTHMLWDRLGDGNSRLANLFEARQHLIHKTHRGEERAVRKYDSASTPFRRLTGHPQVSERTAAAAHTLLATTNPAAVCRELDALAAEIDRLSAPAESRAR
ncbi:MAG: hypothetical protein FWD74_04110 [Actinomycetia bacterium]|nr:hypothetical protein [Actinomycetes bacterium]